MTLGRPRQPSTDAAILRAAIDVARDCGYAGVTFDAVARRAGVTRPTIYRRWPSKSHLLSAALHEVAPSEPIPDTGAGLDDLLLLVSRLQITLIDSNLLGVVLELMVASAGPHAAGEPLRRDYLQLRFQAFDEICRRAFLRGELPSTVSADALRDLVLGPLAFRWFIDGAIDDNAVEQLVTAAWYGLAAQHGAPTRGDERLRSSGRAS